MSGVFKTIGKIAAVVAMIPGPWQPIAAAVAVTASVVGAITAKSPAPTGSSTQITIGANMPAPYIMGQAYYGGNRVHQIGYGVEDDVQNAHAAMVDVYSVGGPVHGLAGIYADFNLVTFTATNADGYYHNNLHAAVQFGQTPEATALAPWWSGTPDWGAGYMLSGMAAIFYNARYPKKGDVFRSGLPQFGAIWQGVLTYDPRADSTYAGGAGDSRWAPPANAADFAAAKLTWTYSTNPGLHALRYALGTWERSGSDPFQLTFGMGLPIDGVIVEDFVALANVCDANGWKVNGVIFEPGDEWENLKNICAAGGAQPCIKGGRLGLQISAPKVSLATLTRDDLADGDISVPATRSYRERLNTIIPKFMSADHKWSYQPSDFPVQVTDYVTQDGEVRSQENQYNLVTSVHQAAQLAAYDLVNGRERSPITMVWKPHVRFYGPGDQLTIDIPEAGLVAQPCIITQRQTDPATMKVTLTMMEETVAKHDFALSQTGSSPPAASIIPLGAMDGAAGSAGSETSLAILNARYTTTTDPLTGSAVGSDGHIVIADQVWNYPTLTSVVTRTGATLTGLALGTRYYVYFDDPTLIDTVPAYAATTVGDDAVNSVANPFRHFLGAVDIPGSGGSPVTGGGGSGGCVTIGSVILMADAARAGAGAWKPARDVRSGDWVWTRHENDPDGPWGAYQVEAVRFVVREVLSLDGHPDATAEHPIWHDGWVLMGAVGAPAGRATIAHMTIADAHTYVARNPGAAAGVLSHNKRTNPDD